MVSSHFVMSSVPCSRKAFVDARVSPYGPGSDSAYVRNPVRRNQDRPQLRDLLLTDVSSPITAPVDATCFEGSPEQTPPDVEDVVVHSLSEDAETLSHGCGISCVVCLGTLGPLQSSGQRIDPRGAVGVEQPAPPGHVRHLSIG